MLYVPSRPEAFDTVENTRFNIFAVYCNSLKEKREPVNCTAPFVEIRLHRLSKSVDYDCRGHLLFQWLFFRCVAFSLLSRASS
jgi:hypothetical protein